MTESSATIDPTKAPAQLGGGAIGKLALALSKAQGTIKNAVKDASNPAFKRDGKESTYADLASVWDACRAALTENQIAVIQQVMGGPDTVTVSTVLAHSSGESIACSVTGKPTKNDVQGIGSTITYLRRYSLAAMVGVAPEDDDGNAAAGKPPVTPAEQKAVQKATEQKPKGIFLALNPEGGGTTHASTTAYLDALESALSTADDHLALFDLNQATLQEQQAKAAKVKDNPQAQAIVTRIADIFTRIHQGTIPGKQAAE